jgi:ketosteroid isomerase-like protein
MRTLVEPLEDETLARRFIALASARDYRAFAELLDPDVVWYGTRGGIDAERVVRGPDAYLAYMREVLGTFERYEFEVEETFRFEGGVLVYLWERGEGRDGIELESRTAIALGIRDGLVHRVQGYVDRDDARRESGLD